MDTIEYKYSNNISVYFTPIENGKAEYFCEVHDFSNLECFKYGRISYAELQRIINSPMEWSMLFF